MIFSPRFSQVLCENVRNCIKTGLVPAEGLLDMSTLIKLAWHPWTSCKAVAMHRYLNHHFSLGLHNLPCLGFLRLPLWHPRWHLKHFANKSALCWLHQGKDPTSKLARLKAAPQVCKPQVNNYCGIMWYNVNVLRLWRCHQCIHFSFMWYFRSWKRIFRFWDCQLKWSTRSLLYLSSISLSLYLSLSLIYLSIIYLSTIYLFNLSSVYLSLSVSDSLGFWADPQSSLVWHCG